MARSAFRPVHTIKGTCGFFEFARLGALTHPGENLLSDLRDGRLSLTPDMATALLQLVDAVRRALGRIERTQAEGDEDHAGRIARLTGFQAGGPAPADDPPPGVSEGTVRVDVALLDRLMTLVGELVLAGTRVQQFTGTRPDPGFGPAAQRLSLIPTGLQEGVMKARMRPTGTVWDEFPRVVRDLATLCGKDVRVAVEGKDTEPDRTILGAARPRSPPGPDRRRPRAGAGRRPRSRSRSPWPSSRP